MRWVVLAIVAGMSLAAAPVFAQSEVYFAQPPFDPAQMEWIK